MIKDFVERRQWGRAGWCRLVSVRRVSGRVAKETSDD